MKILTASDKFKTTLSSREVNSALAEGLRLACPEAEITQLVLSDGGEGFIEALEQAEELRRQAVTLPGPQGNPVQGYLGISKKHRRIYIESCHATGFHLVPAKKLNPLRASSEGLADLIRAALSQRPTEIFIGLGSSATCDAGLPVAENFGYRFYDLRGNLLEGKPGELSVIARIEKPAEIQALLKGTKIYAVADVTNPPAGPAGGVRIYTPQKGASPKEVNLLAKGMDHLVSVMEHESGKKLKKLEGGSAAGCLALGLHYFFGASVIQGADFFFQKLDLARRIRNTDIVITGEGSFDDQSFYGKITGKVVGHAHRCGKTVFLVTGKKKVPSTVRRMVKNLFSVEESIESRSVRNVKESSAALRILGERIGHLLLAPALHH
ncbi:MAG: glycerate kinase [Candidatus Omnitrophica bacterium]|nr:glycerate kinase [Candidatus Omnitrophota bacterium]